MKGDFSKWGLTPADNFSGVLHQQGRVLLDQDWNAAQQIQALWRDTVGQDVVGGGLVAVPVAAANSFQMVSAQATASEVTVTFNPGRAWIDGMHFILDGTAAVTLRAEYLGPPLQSPQQTTASIAAGVRDAVVLEVWDDAFSAYQDPLRLLEPALGGPDTTERVKTSMALKLLRLDADQGCGGLPIDDVFATKGRLSVTPAPTTVIPGPCPVPDSGGYSGFEHYLYRIEIATPDAANNARFKWSQFNGGLVGRGAFASTGATTGTVAITANNQMVNQCGLDAFYVEALAFDAALGRWRVVLSADATLPSADNLSLTSISGTWPAGSTGFFRLWNGIDLVSNFPTGLPISNELNDGILLAFDAPTTDNGNYCEGDYWTFPARAAGVAFDPSVWPTNSVPQGVLHHRAALGILEWTAAPTVTITAAAGEIHDCRHPFLPLARTRGCCTVTVGDNRHSFGQFASIQAAVNALPAAGGTVCVLAGLYDESILIEQRVNIRIHGCGPATRVRASDNDSGPLPAFLVSRSTQIVLEDMAIESGPRSAVQIDNSRHVAVRRCLVQMRDMPTLWQAIYSRGDDILIEGNTIEVLPRTGVPPAPTVPPELGDPRAPAGVNTPPDPVNRGHATRGGIQLAGGSDRVRILENIIRGGIWNGITLGSLVRVDDPDEEDTPDRPNSEDPCDPCRPPDLTDDDPDLEIPRFVSAGDLYDIEIARNRISDMGINGIGVVRFFNLARGGDMIGVHGLHITDNLIIRCMRRELVQVSAAMLRLVAYGGIALARVSDLRILRNEIVGNGRNSAQPVCGVFAIFVQGLQLDDNRILDNGPRGAEPAANAQQGVRGGVHVWVVLPALDESLNAKYTAAKLDQRKMHDAVTTCSVRDNMIVAPLGRALTFFALGPVVVARNRLVTQGTTGRDLDLIAATVLVGNLGFSNEWTPGLLLLLVLFLIGKWDNDKWCEIVKTYGLVKVSNPNNNATAPTQATSLWPPMVRRWASGKTLVSENQVTLDLPDHEPFGFGISSVLVFSLDDVGLVDNQCEITSTNIFHFVDVMVVAGSVRMADNRFAETWMRAVLSGFSIGLMNTTTDNQSTHCLRARAMLPNMRVFKDNLALVRAFCPDECGERGFGEGD
jgi:hypothetical protein